MRTLTCFSCRYLSAHSTRVSQKRHGRRKWYAVIGGQEPRSLDRSKTRKEQAMGTSVAVKYQEIFNMHLNSMTSVPTKLATLMPEIAMENSNTMLGVVRLKSMRGRMDFQNVVTMGTSPTRPYTPTKYQWWNKAQRQNVEQNRKLRSRRGLCYWDISPEYTSLP